MAGSGVSELAQFAHSLIGSFEDLNAATVDDVAKFFKTFYAPNNAALVIVGDIKIPEVKKLVETYFADIEPQPQPKHPDMTEPPVTEPRQLNVPDPLAKVPGVIVGYPGPSRRSPDFYALVMADVLLTGGDSSRIQRNLVKGKQSVIQYEGNLGWPFAGPTDYKAPGNYGLFLLHARTSKASRLRNRCSRRLRRSRLKAWIRRKWSAPERWSAQCASMNCKALRGAPRCWGSTRFSMAILT